MNQNKEIFDQVYELVAQIPKGMVSTYGDIAAPLGLNPRFVGYILHHNPSPGKIPCHRVVNSRGQVGANFAFGGGKAQEKLLEKEGVVFDNGKTDLNRFRHQF